MPGSVLKPCACEHEYQEKRHPGLRVYNLSADNSKGTCTVCNAVKSFSVTAVKKEEKKKKS